MCKPVARHFTQKSQLLDNALPVGWHKRMLAKVVGEWPMRSAT
jgi:hypothetical protein